MTLDDALTALADADCDLPEDALRWCLDHWNSAAPVFLERLEHFADGSDRSDQNCGILFFALHLMAEQGERRAFAPLCRALGSSDDAAEALLGDGVTETLRQILISVYDDDFATLKGLIMAPKAEALARCATFDALAWLVWAERIDRDQAVAWLAGLSEGLRGEEPDSWVWIGWASAISLLGLEELAPLVRSAYAEGVIDVTWGDVTNFEEDLKRTLDDPKRMAGFVHESIHPFIDTIVELSHWYVFSEERKQDEQRNQERKQRRELERLCSPPTARNAGRASAPISTAPRVATQNPHRGVGRNDPCPCGSGKKFKKCCLK